MKAFALFLCICLCLSAYSQEIKPEEKLILGDSLVFLGIDFGVAKMIHAADMDQSLFIRDKHGPYWGIIGEYMCQHSNLKFDFEKKNILCKARLLDSSYTKLQSDWIVSSYPGITEQEISQHVKSLPHLQGYKVGIVFIVDKMDKSKAALSMYGGYVNLSDNSVLKTIKCVGTPDGFGYSMYWATGIDQAYEHFTIDNHNYLHRLKHYFKKNP